MQNVTANFYECLHCRGEGTCRSGSDGKSCAACVKRNELKKGKSYSGLLCGSCFGIGKAEPLTERLDKRAAPILAIYLVIGLLVLISISAIFQSPYFSEILAFGSAVIGSVVGFYFSNNSKNSS